MDKGRFGDSAVTVFRRVLSVHIACKWLEWCEENMMGQSPWAKSIYALQALVDRAQTSGRIGWAVWGLTDLYRMELVNVGDFTVGKLKDYRQRYIEVLNLKHALRDHPPPLAAVPRVCASDRGTVAGCLCRLRGRSPARERLPWPADRGHDVDCRLG